MKTSAHINKIKSAVVLAALPFLASAAETNNTADSGSFSNPLFNTLLIIIIVLAIMVITLGKALKNVIGSDFFIEKLKKQAEEKKSAGKITLSVLFVFLCLSGFSMQTEQVMDNSIGGLDKGTFYIMSITIAAEFLVLGILFNTFKNVLGAQKTKSASLPKLKTKSLLDKINATVELENEDSILLDHSYDGIKELDNDLPPWWKYGFYLTILISVFYMIHYHVSETGPLQAEEYKTSIKKAEIEIAEYMKTSANNVDESTVKLLTDPADVGTGKDLFIATCSACHGQSGEGTVGPNLTDDYWLHGGSIQDVFKTIKYGWPDKGMKSWKDDFSPMQIAQLTSFLRTLKGTNPSKPKEKQGELYIEKQIPNDSLANHADSTKVLSALTK